MKIHDLKPAEGSNRRRKRVGRGIGGKGGKTAGRGTKGQGARDTIPVGFEGGQMPLHMRVPKLQGLQQPVPGRVPGHQPRHPRGHRPRRGQPRRSCTARASPTRAPSSRCSAAARSPAPSPSRPTPSRSRPRRPSPPPAVRSRSCRCRGATVARRPRATTSPTARHRARAGRAGRRQEPGSRVLASLKNIFKVPDLRNKVLFTLAMIALYRFGAYLPVPGIDVGGAPAAAASRPSRAASSPSCSCSRAARSPSSRSSRSGSCRTSRRRSSCRSSRVVIPKLEQWQNQGAVGQRKITQWTRYVTIAIAVMQSTGLAFLFHNGGGGFGPGQHHRPRPRPELQRVATCCSSCSPSPPAPRC